MFLCECPLSVSVCLAWASGRWPPHARASGRRVTTFRGGCLVLFHVRTFPGVVVDVTSAMAWAATSSTLTHLVEEILHHEKQQRWRRPLLGANFLFRAPVFSHKFLLDISRSMRPELMFSHKPAHQLSETMWNYRLLVGDASDTGGTVVSIKMLRSSKCRIRQKCTKL